MVRGVGPGSAEKGLMLFLARKSAIYYGFFFTRKMIVLYPTPAWPWTHIFIPCRVACRPGEKLKIMILLNLIPRETFDLPTWSVLLVQRRRHEQTRV